MKIHLLLAVVAPIFAQQLVMVSGNGQLMQEQFPSPQRMVVRALDSAGRPVGGVPVNWSITRGQGTIQTPDTRTNEDGYASAGFLATSIQPGSSYLQSVVTAAGPSNSINFFMTTNESLGGRAQPIIQVLGSSLVRGRAGSTVPEAFVVQVAAGAGAFLGQGIPNVGVRVASTSSEPSAPTAACDAPGGIVLTTDSERPNERGIARCNLVLGPNAGTGSFVVIVGEVTTSREFGLEVTPGQACNVTVSPATLSFGASGGSLTFNVSAVNCAWTATAAAPWISLSGNTSGTGNGQVTVTVAANSGGARSALISVGNANVNVTQTAAGTSVPLAFAVGPTLPQATTGIAYTFTLSVSGGQPPYTWTASGSLPPGIALNSSTGVVSGTISSAGSYTIPVTVRDAAGTTINQTFTLVVSSSQNPGGSGLRFTTTSLPPGLVNAAYSQEILATGGCPNPFFGGPRLEIFSGGLPPGVISRSARSGTGIEITGVPTQAGTFVFGVRASDACGAFVTQQFTLQISTSTAAPPMTANPVALNFSFQRGSGRTPSDQTLSLETGGSSTAFTAAASSDAGWLAISPNSGSTPATLTARVTNTDLQPGTYTGAVTITSGAPNSPLTIPATLTITAVTSAAVSPSSLTFDFEPGGIVSQPQTISVSSAGSALPFTATASTATGGSWLSVTQTGLSTPAFVTVTINPVGLAPGTYNGSVAIVPAFNAPPVTVPVILNVGRTGPVLTSVTSGASFLPGAVAPGQIVTLFGTNLGPPSLVTFQLTPAGRVDTQLSDVRVFFDDLAAPVLHASSMQTTVIVPYGIAGRTSTRMQVEYRGVRSAAVNVPVAEAAPGLFTIGGTSQGAILNQDNSVNGPQNGAQPGTIVSLYATGEGITMPPSVEGSVTAPDALARPVLPVSVMIGGRQAEVLYAGSAPGLVAGALQVNVRVPLDTPGGTSVPVVLTVGSASSQPGATMSVRP